MSFCLSSQQGSTLYGYNLLLIPFKSWSHLEIICCPRKQTGITKLSPFEKDVGKTIYLYRALFFSDAKISFVI